ncbi:unnamed protein product [Symbiodinium microadriaticum]|nr:unnamed protein product [Symbiodinium microadriaticum]
MTDKPKCKSCACSFIDNIPKCGTELVTSASKCGEVVVSCTWKVIKDVVKCAKHGFTGKKCKVKKCKKKAKACQAPKSCFQVIPFEDCMSQLAKDKGGDVAKAISVLKDTNVVKPKDLKKLVLSGIPSVAKQLGKELAKLMPDEVYRLFSQNKLSGYLDSVLNTLGKVQQELDPIWNGLTSFLETLGDLGRKAASGPRKLPRNKDGEFCLFKWDFTVFFFTDCGYFEAVDSLWGHVAQGYNPKVWGKIDNDYASMAKALAKCAQLKTTIPIWKKKEIKVSTPFQSLQQLDYCLPKIATDGAQLLWNTFDLAWQEMPGIYAEIRKIANMLADYADSLIGDNLNFFEENYGLLQTNTRRAGSGGRGTRGMAGLRRNFMCSKKNNMDNYAIMLRFQFGVSNQLGTFSKQAFAWKSAQTAGAGIYFGCDEAHFKVLPFVNFRLGSLGVSFPPSGSPTNENPDKNPDDKNGVLSISGDFQVKMYPHEYPAFKNHVKFEGAFQLTGGLKSEGPKGFKGTLRSSVAWYSPDITSGKEKDWKPEKPGTPSGVGFTIAMKLGETRLLEETGDLASAVRRDLSELGQNESGLLEDLHQLSKAEVWPTGSFDARIQAYFCLQSNGACEGEEEKKKL